MATRSPFFTPSFFMTFANFCTSTYRSQYVSVRRSPGSPSQTSAALLRRGPSMCRSTQLYDTLSFPPRNHFACGGFHCSTFFHGLNKWRSVLAWVAQNFSWFLARPYTFGSLTTALRLNSADGLNFRFSVRRASISFMQVILKARRERSE